MCLLQKPYCHWQDDCDCNFIIFFGIDYHRYRMESGMPLHTTSAKKYIFICTYLKTKLLLLNFKQFIKSISVISVFFSKFSHNQHKPQLTNRPSPPDSSALKAPQAATTTWTWTTTRAGAAAASRGCRTAAPISQVKVNVRPVLSSVLGA